VAVITIDEIKKLHQKKYRQQVGYFLAEGEHLVLELQKAMAINPALRSSQLYVTERYEGWNTELIKNIVSEKLMRQLSGTQSPQGIIACVPIAGVLSGAVQQISTASRCVYLHEIQDPGNLGTILRTLAWFGGLTCILSPGCVDPFNPKVVRASMGALFYVPLELEVPLSSLTGRFDRLGMLDMSGSSLASPEFKQLQCLIFGNEARGVPHEQLAVINPRPFSITGSGRVDSLNLAAAVNMSLYELNRDTGS
jgi:TrmH family RNA methyltransferase